MKCTTENVCLFCDAINKYYLKDGSCYLSEDKNCLNLDPAGNCI